MKHHVLLTGAAGYVGSHAAKHLAGQGFVPVTYDDLSRGHRQAVRWGPFVRGSLADRARLVEVMRYYRPVGVLHFAGLAYVGESIGDPGPYYTHNVGGTLSLLQAMRTTSVDRLIFSSSCATYGIPRHLPLTEDHAQEPVSPYGRSKFAAEGLIGDFAAAHGMWAVCLRYFNAAGADRCGAIGESHHPETHLIPLALAAADDGPALRIFGGDHPTPDGTCVRDYVHVSDLAEAHALALRLLLDGQRKGVPAMKLNLGSGAGHSVLDIVARVRRITGRDPAHEWSAPRPGDPPILTADATRAAALLGWKPRADLGEILASAWRWHRNRRY